MKKGFRDRIKQGMELLLLTVVFMTGFLSQKAAAMGQTIPVLGIEDNSGVLGKILIGAGIVIVMVILGVIFKLRKK